MWKLVIEDDEGKRTVVPLTRDDYTIGRKDGNTIRLTERNVSREHAKLQKKNGASNGAAANPPAYVLEDLTSYNGVYINGLRVAQTQELAHGDLIQIGDYRIILQDDVATEAENPDTIDSEDMKATMPQVGSLPLRSEMLLTQPNRLVMLAGPTPGAEYPLTSERLTIGRAEDATISVNHNSVSRLHCEVHALGEGRFEIVDKGSSNGVRLNGADLRRGIIEAGDTIELGDVKFKFVGQGQIFRPGSTESQRLAAIGNRSLGVAAQGERRKTSIAPYVVLGAVVGLGVAAWFYYHPRPEPIGAEPVAQVVSADMATLLDAKRVCDTGDCEAAHQRVAQLAENSPARQSQEFKDLEFKWAAMILMHADAEPDFATKRTLFERVADTPTVDQHVRDAARDRLQLLEPGPVLATKDAGRGIIAVAPSAQHPTAHPTETAILVPPQPAVTHPLAATTPKPLAAPPVKQSPFDLAKSANPADWQKARDILEPKVYGGRGSMEEIRLLRGICKTQGDHSCMDTCSSMMPAPTATQPP